MADKPIIYSGLMMKALLDGRKTQTRRALKPQPVPHTQPFLTSRYIVNIDDCGTLKTKPLPYAPGDRLWVREAFKVGNDLAPELDLPTMWIYRATAGDPTGPWRSPIHMPRRASRLTLTVTDVRVQRVQEISEADARAEGAVPAIAHPNELDLAGNGSYRDSFRNLWNSIHRRAAWNENPWVAALTFDVHRCNIDADGGA